MLGYEESHTATGGRTTAPGIDVRWGDGGASPAAVIEAVARRLEWLEANEGARPWLTAALLHLDGALAALDPDRAG